MTAEPKQESFEEEYEEYDEFDEEENERGLSGLVVLLMGVVMLGAFASVVMIAYQQGIKSGATGTSSPPTITADPDPVKIENKVDATPASGNDRAVYDAVDGTTTSSEVLAEAPEEPVARDGAPAATPDAAGEPGAVVDDAVADRIASLAAADEAAETTPEASTSGPPATAPTPVKSETPPPAASQPAPKPVETATPKPAVAASGDALSGTHLVQVGAFKSDAEATSNWSKLQSKLGDYLNGKSEDVERADLGDKGVFFRLRIGPFASSADAKTFCEGLKSRGADCIVKAK